MRNDNLAMLERRLAEVSFDLLEVLKGFDRLMGDLETRIDDLEYAEEQRASRDTQASQNEAQAHQAKPDQNDGAPS